FHADRVVVTVPGPLVSEVGFEPVLPAQKVRALLELRYGNATRLVMQYAERDLVRAAIGAGCYTDRMPGFVMEHPVHQAGAGTVVSGLAAGDGGAGGPAGGEALEQGDANRRPGGWA